MDHATDPAVLPPSMCQQLTNCLADRQGNLRANVQSVTPTLSPPPFASIDGIGYLYQTDGYYTTLGGAYVPPVPGRMAVAQGGQLNSYPVASPLQYPPTFGAGAFGAYILTGQRVRFAGFLTDLFAVQQNNSFSAYQMKSNGAVLPMGIISPFIYAPNLVFSVTSYPSIPIAWAPSTHYTDSGPISIVSSNLGIWQCIVTGTSGVSAPDPGLNPVVGTTEFIDGGVTWLLISNIVTVSYAITVLDDEMRESSPSQPQTVQVWSTNKNVKIVTTVLGTEIYPAPRPSYVAFYGTLQNGTQYYLLPTPSSVDGTALAAWAATVTYTQYTSIVTNDGAVWLCDTPGGTSAGTGPQVPGGMLTPGSTTVTETGGTLVWIYLGTVANYINPAVATGGAIVAYVDDFADTITEQQNLMPGFGENDPPLPASLIAVQGDRIVMNVVGVPSGIQISNTNSGTQFAAVQVINPDGTVRSTDGGTLQITTDSGNPINGFASFGSYLMIACRRGIWSLQGTDFNDFESRQVHDRGCIAPDSVVRCDNHVAFLSDDGVYVISYIYRFIIEKFSKPIEPDLFAFAATVEGYAALEAAQGAFVNNCYYLGIGTSLYRYDFDLQGWSQLNLFGGASITCMFAMQQVDTPRVLFVGRSDNTVCMIDEYTFPQAVSGIVYRTRVIQPDPTDRDAAGNTAGSLRKRARRVRVRGSGTLTGTNTVTLNYDGNTEVWTLNNSAAALPVELVQGILIGQGFSAATVGRYLDIQLNLQGTGLIIKSVELESVTQG